MENRKLGHSGIEVSALSLGSWQTFEHMDEADALAVMNAALASGINFFDDARYDDTTGKAPLKTGYSEVLFGRLLAASTANRDQLIISNRLWLEFYPRQTLEQEIDESLARIGIDHFDLVFCMAPPDMLPMPTLVTELGELIATGKIRHWGPANWTTAQLAEGCAFARASGAPLPTAVMLPYSLLNRTSAEDPRLPGLCLEYGFGLVASFALAGGALTGKFNRPDPATIRSTAQRIEKLRADGVLAKVDQLIAVARRIDLSATHVALAYCLRHPHVSSLLFGATSEAQVHENVSALDAISGLGEGEIEELQRIFS